MKKHTYKIIYASIVIALIGVGFGLVGYFNQDALSGDVLLLPDGELIYFTHTDDNTDENIIIKSDKKDYEGLNGNLVYFSVSKLKRGTELIDLSVHFDNDQGNVEKVEKWDKVLNVWFPITGAVSVKGTDYFRMAINYPPLSNGEFWIEANGDKGGYGLLDPWYSSSWKYRKAITINSSQITANQTNFPVLATSTDTDLIGKTRDDGYDIVFADTGGNVLNYEREKYDPTTGEIAYWIKTDISSTTDKTIYMYYGNASASDLATTTGVWDDNFVMVNHLAHDGVATTTYPDFLDSTKYNNDGSSVNMNSDDLVDGQVDGSLDFDGVDDYVNLPITEDSGNRTRMAWIYPRTVPAGLGDGIISNIDWDAGSIHFKVEDGGVKASIKDATIFTTLSAITAYDWYYVAVTYDNSTKSLRLYVNGIQVDSETTTNALTVLDEDYIGNEYDGARHFNGIIDEVRISNVARTAGWIATEYNNQSDVGSFLTIGAEESSATTKVSSPQTNKLIVNAPITNYLTDGLVGHWTFNGQDMDWASTTAEALDRSGNSNNGNVIGATAAIGKVGQGLRFDGVDDYVDCGDVYNGVKTLAFWLKADSVASKKIIDIDGTDQIETDASGNILATSFPTATIYIDSAVASLITTDWHFITITDTTGVNASAMDIGRVSTGYFDGLIDEARIYNRALSADEVGELYRVGARKMKLKR